MNLTLIFYLRLMFLILFAKELILTKFKNKKNKYIWFIIVFIMGYWGYSFYIAYKRKLVVKRKFNPDFSKYKDKNY